MPPIINIYRSGELIRKIEGAPGDTLLQSISAAGVFLDSPCGGNGKCGKCLVRLGSEAEEVLACRTRIDGDMCVCLPDEMEMGIAGAERLSGERREEREESETRDASVNNDRHWVAKHRFGVAVDIGTTTVVAYLADLETGVRIAAQSGINAQRAYGADVISRIRHCAANGHETLTRLIREQLASMILEMCAASGVGADSIEYVVIAANTIMEHLAAGYSPVGMGAVPFTTVSLFGEDMAAWDGLPASKNAKIYFAPAISAYVGGDITAGMLAAKLEDMAGPTVYLDIGTNGEMALKAGDTYYCCATAAGPAFEGAEITMGMAAVNGAINHVKWDNGLKYSVIGDGAPRGLCGSGLLDALAVLLETGAVDETGRMLGAEEIDHDIAGHIGEDGGKNVLRLTSGNGSVFMTASDVRKLQLAKSAIAAGIQTLLSHAGITEAQVNSFVLAGSFGSFMDLNSAARIGLFPRSFLPVAQTLGNTAGEGAAIALCSEAQRAALREISEKCEYIELSSSPVFNEQFMEQMTF